MSVPASVFGIPPPSEAYSHHPTVNARNLVARLRSPRRRSPSPKQTFENLLLEEYGPRAALQKAPQRAYKEYYNTARAMSTRRNVRKYVKQLGGSIPNQPELQRPSRPLYQGRKAGMTSKNKILHKYPQLLPLFFKPNATFSPIVTAYLASRPHLPGYTFFPPYPNRTRRRNSRSRSIGSSSGSNGNSRSNGSRSGSNGNGRSRSPKSPRRAHRKQRAVPNRSDINMRNLSLERTSSTNSNCNSV